MTVTNDQQQEINQNIEEIVKKSIVRVLVDAPSKKQKTDELAKNLLVIICILVFCFTISTVYLVRELSSTKQILKKAQKDINVIRRTLNIQRSHFELQKDQNSRKR